MEPQQSKEELAAYERDCAMRAVGQREGDPTRPGEVINMRLNDLAARLAKLEAWARGYAGPLLYRGLEMGEKMEVNKKTPYDPPVGRDIPDLKLREL